MSCTGYGKTNLVGLNHLVELNDFPFKIQGGGSRNEKRKGTRKGVK